MLTCTTIILLMLVVTIITQGISLRDSLVDKTTTLAKVIGANSQESLGLDRNYKATPILETLKAEPSIQVAYIFDSKNDLFAHYLNNKHTSFADTFSQQTFNSVNLQLAADKGKTVYNFTGNSLCLYSPVFQNGRYLGSVYLQAELNNILINLLWHAVIAIIFLTVALIIAYMLTARLQSHISEPLHQLMLRMKTVTEDKIYIQNKQPIVHNDITEIAEIQNSFDDMLIQINNRQNELQEHSHHLEEQVMKRTIDLQSSNNELRNTVHELGIARQEALEASAAKSKFLANMGHEIRTPMIGVLGMAELLLKKAGDNYQRELTRTILSSGESLMAILNDLLDISKIEAGKLELEKKPFNPVTTMESAVDVLANQAFEKGLEITTIPSPHLPEQLEGDAGRIRQIILNLLSNAIKFTAQGHISIFMNSTQTDDNHIKLNLRVCDSGIGLSEQAKEKIFNAFTQADISTTRNYGGTGLGLTIVKQLVELMGGNINVKDTKPHGCCFSVDIPFHIDANTKLSTQQAPHNINEKAIVATTNPDLAQFLTQHLAALGVTSSRVKSYTIVQQILEDPTDKTAMIFLDLALPDGGINFLLQEPHKINATKLILIAQRLYKLNNARQQLLGIDHLLIKPVKANQLRQLLFPTKGCEQAPTITKETTPKKSKKAKILLAEDNPTNQRLVQLILEQDNYKLTIVSDGEQAVQAADTIDFDLILMDCQMPVMDGYEAAKIIRKKNSTPIIALTAHASEHNDALCAEAGMDSQLHKPFRRQQLLSIIEKFLNQTINQTQNTVCTDDES